VLGHLSDGRRAARRWTHATPLLLALAMAASPTACSTDPVEGVWEPRTCSDEEWALIDHSLAELRGIEGYMDEALGRRFADDAPAFAEMVDALMTVRTEEKLECAAPAEGAEAGWIAMYIQGEERVLINVDTDVWAQTTADWAGGREYAELSASEVVERVETLDPGEYPAFELSALLYFRGPAAVCRSLAHEAAHLTTGCCDHGFEDVEREADFVDEVGQLAYDAIYFERWHPEWVWLDQVYRDAQSDAPAQSNLAPPWKR